MAGFDGKVAVVTGAASGIGLEMARQLCDAGAIVVAADIDAERLKTETSLISGALTTKVVDVADRDAIQQLIDGTVEEHGRIDYLFNIAGIGGTSGEVRDQVPEDWERIVGINQMAVIHGSSFAYAHMRAQGSGHIVNMASAAGLLGSAAMNPYATTKAAVVSFSRDLRVEAATFGVNVTVLCPGFIESRIFENTVSNQKIDVKKVKDSLPFKFLPTDEAVATMLRAVLRNKAVVVLPFSMKFLWWLRRMFPLLTDRTIGGRIMAEFRKSRLSDEA